MASNEKNNSGGEGYWNGGGVGGTPYGTPVGRSKDEGSIRGTRSFDQGGGSTYETNYREGEKTARGGGGAGGGLRGRGGRWGPNGNGTKPKTGWLPRFGGRGREDDNESEENLLKTWLFSGTMFDYSKEGGAARERGDSASRPINGIEAIGEYPNLQRRGEWGGTPTSIKRKRDNTELETDSLYKSDTVSLANESMDGFCRVSEFARIAKNKIDELKKTVDSSTSGGKLCEVLGDVFEGMEKEYNSMANIVAKMGERIDMLEKNGSNYKDILCKNVVGGNIALETVDCKAYSDVCDKVKESAITTKIFGLDLGNRTEGRGEVLKKSREALEKVDLNTKGGKIFPLGNSTQIRDGTHSIPILVVSKTKSEKIELERGVREKGLMAAFHWPKEIVPSITKIREDVKKIKLDGGLNMAEMDILIRPSETGKSITISYRKKSDRSNGGRGGNRGQWSILDTVRTPAPSELVNQLKGQPCQSRFFKL